MFARVDLTGLRFGRLTVLRLAPRIDRKQWLCACDCGGTKITEAGRLRAGTVQSCGCLRSVGGLSNTPIYYVWRAMLKRCSNPKHQAWKFYGARGIKVCARWQSFDNFRADMGEPPTGKSLDRIDNNGDYNSSNCRWATRQEQMRNMRGNRFLTFKGKTQTIAAWADEMGMNQKTLRARLLYGWGVDKSISNPLNKKMAALRAIAR